MAPWPWPRDSREDRAKRVALSYRHLVETWTPGDIDLGVALAALDDRWCDLGAGWVRPIDGPLDLDEWLTDAEMGELFHQAPKTVYAWAHRGRIRFRLCNDGVRRYNVGDVVDYQRSRRLRR